MSVPVASQASPAATAAAEPPEDPPVVHRVSQGLQVTPNTSLTVLPPAPNSGVLDFADDDGAVRLEPLDHDVRTAGNYDRRRRVIPQSSARRRPRSDP